MRTGLSAYAAERQGRNKASAYPWLGRFIVRLEIPEVGPITWERTTTSRGHYTLWGTPGDLLGSAAAVLVLADVE